MEESGSGERALGTKKITVRMDTSPSLLGSSVNDWSVLAEKQKLNMDCNFLNSIFRLPPKTEKLRHVTDCSFSIFLFIVDRIIVKI